MQDPEPILDTPHETDRAKKYPFNFDLNGGVGILSSRQMDGKVTRQLSKQINKYYRYSYSLQIYSLLIYRLLIYFSSLRAVEEIFIACKSTHFLSINIYLKETK